METIKKDNSGTLSPPGKSGKAATDCTLCPRNATINRMAGRSVLPADGDAAGGKGSAALLGRTVHLGHGRFGCSVFWRLLDAVRVLPEPRYCGRRSRTGNFGGTPERNFSGTAEKGSEQYQPRDTDAFCTADCSGARAAKREGLRIPIVYNTSSYEKVSTLQLLDGLVDIYLPDLKYESAALSGLLSNAPDYFETAAAAIAEMVRQVGEPVFARRMGRCFSQRR